MNKNIDWKKTTACEHILTNEQRWRYPQFRQISRRKDSQTEEGAKDMNGQFTKAEA